MAVAQGHPVRCCAEPHAAVAAACTCSSSVLFSIWSTCCLLLPYGSRPKSSHGACNAKSFTNPAGLAGISRTNHLDLLCMTQFQHCRGLWLCLTDDIWSSMGQSDHAATVVKWTPRFPQQHCPLLCIALAYSIKTTFDKTTVLHAQINFGIPLTAHACGQIFASSASWTSTPGGHFGDASLLPLDRYAQPPLIKDPPMLVPAFQLHLQGAATEMKF